MGKRETIVAYCRKQLGCAYSYTPSGGREGSAYNCSYLSTCAYKAAGSSNARGLLTNGRTYTYTFIKWT